MLDDMPGVYDKDVEDARDSASRRATVKKAFGRNLMSPRVKKLILIAVLMPALIAYLFAAAALSEALPSFWLVKLAYFLVAGVVWAFPVKYLILWANSEPPAERKNSR